MRAPKKLYFYGILSLPPVVLGFQLRNWNVKTSLHATLVLPSSSYFPFKPAYVPVPLHSTTVQVLFWSIVEILQNLKNNFCFFQQKSDIACKRKRDTSEDSTFITSTPMSKPKRPKTEASTVVDECNNNTSESSQH